jgi:hypothetical protein
MVYTRSSSAVAQALLSLRNARRASFAATTTPIVVKARSTLPSKRAAATAAATAAPARATTSPKSTQFWREWANWYSPFLAELKDEGVSGPPRFKEAEARWTTFCAKRLHCSEAAVQSWLKNTSSASRLARAGY